MREGEVLRDYAGPPITLDKVWISTAVSAYTSAWLVKRQWVSALAVQQLVRAKPEQKIRSCDEFISTGRGCRPQRDDIQIEYAYGGVEISFRKGAIEDVREYNAKGERNRRGRNT